MNMIEHLKKYLNRIYDHNSFVRLLDITIAEMGEGEAVLIMPVDPDKHTNLYHALHGGALASLADTAMGVSCATLGNRVVTVEMNINFIKSAGKGETVRAQGRVIHAGRQTMVVECDMHDSSGSLLGKARGTFMVIGRVEAEEA